MSDPLIFAHLLIRELTLGNELRPAIPIEIASHIIETTIGICKVHLCKNLTFGPICLLHMCKTPGCQKSCREPKRLCTKCTLELTCTIGTCARIKAPGSEYCLAHKCTIKNCPNGALGQRYDCYDHICKNCQYNTILYGNYCHKCKCKLLYCQNLSVDNHDYCSSHKCKNTTCSNIRKINNDYCVDHLCKVNGCDNPVDLFKYCKSHKCRINVCGNKRKSYYKYCQKHLCIVKKCKKHKEYNDYCGKHYCRFCETPNLNNSHNHKCIICNTDFKLVGKNICIKHICKMRRCFKPRSLNSIYCIEHKCGFDSCACKKSKSSLFCKTHKCEIKSCINPISSNSILYCDIHIN